MTALVTTVSAITRAQVELVRTTLRDIPVPSDTTPEELQTMDHTLRTMAGELELLDEETLHQACRQGMPSSELLLARVQGKSYAQIMREAGARVGGQVTFSDALLQVSIHPDLAQPVGLYTAAFITKPGDSLRQAKTMIRCLEDILSIFGPDKSSLGGTYCPEHQTMQLSTPLTLAVRLQAIKDVVGEVDTAIRN